MPSVQSAQVCAPRPVPSGNVARDLANEQRLARIALTHRDVDVPLSGLGRQQAEALGRWFAEAHEDGRSEIMLASPYVRAMQTAEVARRVLGVEAEIVRSDAFTPNVSPLTAWAEIRTYEQEEQVMIATHEPIVSSLFSFLLGVSEHVHDFKKAGLAKLEMARLGARPAASVNWILTPALASAIKQK